MAKRIPLPTEEQRHVMMEWYANLERQRAIVRERQAFYAEHYDQIRDNGADEPHEVMRKLLDGDPSGRYVLSRVEEYLATPMTHRLWSRKDIAVVMGLDLSAVENALAKILDGCEYSGEMRERLEECSQRDAGGDILYDDRIFDVLLDCQGEDHLRGILFPQRQNRLPTLDEAESIRQFWDGLALSNRDRKPRRPEDNEEGKR